MGPLFPKIPRMPRSGLRTAGFGFVDLQALPACEVQPCVTRTRREGTRGVEPDVADTSRAQAGLGGRGCGGAGASVRGGRAARRGLPRATRVPAASAPTGRFYPNLFVLVY